MWFVSYKVRETYTQKEKVSRHGRWYQGNTVTDMHPILWLKRYQELCPSDEMLLIFYSPLDPETSQQVGRIDCEYPIESR